MVGLRQSEGRLSEVVEMACLERPFQDFGDDRTYFRGFTKPSIFESKLTNGPKGFSLSRDNTIVRWWTDGEEERLMHLLHLGYFLMAREHV